MEEAAINWQIFYTEAQDSHLHLFLTLAETNQEAEAHLYQLLDTDRHNLLLAVETASTENAWDAIQRFTWAVGRPYGGYLSTYGLWEELKTLIEAAIFASHQLMEPIIAAGFMTDLGTLILWQGQLAEAKKQYETALSVIKGIPPERATELAVARIYHHLGTIYRTLSDTPQARNFLQKALTLSKKWGDDGGVANNLQELGNLANDENNLDQALCYYQQSLTINLILPHPINAAINRRNIGNILYKKDELILAEKQWQKALGVFTQHNDKRNVAGILHALAQLSLDKHQYDTARQLCIECIDLKEQIGFRSALPNTISLLGIISYAEDNGQAAERYFQQALDISITNGDPRQANRQRFNLAMLYELREQFPQAEQLLKQVVAIDAEYNLPDLAANQKALQRIQTKLS